MGTRSTTRFFEDDKLICVFYRQMDGYPSGHGAELAQILASGKLVNGIGGDKGRVFNGMGCLAAQVIAEMKDGPGHIYMVSADHGGEEYNYEVRGFFDVSKPLEIRCNSAYSDTQPYIFKGSLAKFKKFCKEYKG